MGDEEEIKGWKEDDLFENDRVRIGYLENSPEDHVIYIRENASGEEKYQFLIPRGILRELAGIKDSSELVRKIHIFNPELVDVASKEFVFPNELSGAIRKAYATEEENRQKWFKEQGLEF